jgi:hypothetical protein
VNTKSKSFIVYRRQGETVTAHRARLYQAGQMEDGWPIIDVAVGPAVPWPELYAGHTAWVGEQIARQRDAIKAERQRRAEKRGQAPKVSA